MGDFSRISFGGVLILFDEIISGENRLFFGDFRRNPFVFAVNPLHFPLPLFMEGQMITLPRLLKFPFLAADDFSEEDLILDAQLIEESIFAVVIGGVLPLM